MALKDIPNEPRYSYTEDEIQTLIKMEDEFKNLEHTWRNDGRGIDTQKKIGFEDAITVPNAHIFLPKVMTKIVKEAQEPMLIGAKLLRRVNYKAGIQIEFPSVGATGQADMVSELGEYPKLSPAVSVGTVIARIGKFGLAVEFSEEILRYSVYDVYNMMLELAGRDLARLKEKIIFTYILDMGTTVFDNINWNDPTASVKGPTTGRNRKGEGNGSITLDDLFDMFAHLIHQGYMPDTLLIHPMTWLMWVKDPLMRIFALNNGGGTWFATWSGNPASRDPWESHGGLGVSAGRNVGKNADNTNWDFNFENQNSSMNIPNRFPVPLRIIVSPLVPYSWQTQLTNIMMFDSKNLGVLVVDEEPTTQKWDDMSVDLHSVKIRERYGVAILNEGQAIAVAKGIKVDAYNELILPAVTMADVSSAIDIGVGVNVLGL